MTEEFLQYDKMVETALKSVVRTALQSVEKQGLYGAHHFYITFLTEHAGVQIPLYLKEKYQGEMTIVLQYQFNNLNVSADQFHVSLSFNNIEESLTIPFAAITGFADPSVKFGLQFHRDDLLEDDDIEDVLSLAFLEDGEEVKSNAPAVPTADNANVISLDTFRKK